MDYLHQEFESFNQARKKGMVFEEVFPWKAVAYEAFRHQIQPYFREEGRILEVGVGSGFLLAQLARSGYTVVGVDNDDVALQYAQTVFENRQARGSFLKADAFALPFADDYFDAVTSNGMIEHYEKEEQIQLLKEMARVSRDKVIVSTPNDHESSSYHGYKESDIYVEEEENIFDLEEIVTAAGLTHIHESGFNAFDSATIDWFKENYNRTPTSAEIIQMELQLSDELKRQKAMFKFSIGEVPKLIQTLDLIPPEEAAKLFFDLRRGVIKTTPYLVQIS